MQILLQRIHNLGAGHGGFRIIYATRVLKGETYSGWQVMKGGILQGSALGPLLFLI